MKNSFLLVRHSYDDHSYIDGKNDTSLTSNGIAIAQDAVRRIISYVDSNDIIIRHSSKKEDVRQQKFFVNIS